MPAAAVFRHRRALRAAACAVAMAAGLQTVAGGGPASSADRAVAGSAATSSARVASPTAQAVSQSSAMAFAAPASTRPARQAAGPGTPADPPPFAPGGDDLLAWENAPAAPAATAVHVAAMQAAPALGSQRSLPAPALPTGPADGWLIADFFGPGQPGAFVLVPGGRGPAGVRFLAPDAAGRWQDRSAALLADAADRRACARPGVPLAADVNGDGRPDVYLPCGGGRAGEAHAQLLFLSRADGSYARTEAAAGFEASRAEAADVDGDGHLDIATTDTTWGAWRPLLLRGLGDGRFEVQGL